MKIPINIRQLYSPKQPTVTSCYEKVMYTELFPHQYLQNFIYCYWQLNTTETLSESFVYRVVADGCIDIYFELNHPANNYVMGFCRKYAEFPLDSAFNYIGIRFLPTAFPQLFKMSAKELSDNFFELKNVLPEISRYISEYLQGKSDLTQIKHLFDNYFINYLSKTSIDSDIRLYKALEIIFRNTGALNVETDLNTGISPRQLRRLFEYYIGDTAKIFAKVVRFQHILKIKPSAQSLRQDKLFFDVGYYDQAHFIKDFKDLYGVTPCKAFGR